MAAMAKNLSLFLLLSSLLLHLSHARDSQFFSKVSNNIPQLTPTKEQPFNTNQHVAEDGGSYGLYGHETGQLPPSSTTNNNNLPSNLPENYNPVAYTTPIHANTQDLPFNYNQDSYVTQPQGYRYNSQSGTYNSEKQEQFSDNGENMYNSQKQEVETYGGGVYKPEKQGMSDTRFLENGRYYHASERYSPQKQGLGETMFMENNEGYNSQKQGTTSGGNMYNNIEKQGMSDTRFLENGKYFYDLASENFNANANGNSRTNGYNPRGYYGNNNEDSYDRYRFNPKVEYQNQQYQENQEDEFNP